MGDPVRRRIDVAASLRELSRPPTFDLARATGGTAPRPGVDWPQFRGIRASGIDDKHPAPLTWNVEKGERVVWKTPLPGLGHASPVVWGDAVYLATAISSKPFSRCLL